MFNHNHGCLYNFTWQFFFIFHVFLMMLAIKCKLKFGYKIIDLADLSIKLNSFVTEYHWAQSARLSRKIFCLDQDMPFQQYSH